VTAQVVEVGGGASEEVSAKYLIGGDGARSFVRRTLGIHYAGEAGAVRDFFGGRMYAIYLYSPQFYQVVPHGPAWMNVTFNKDRRAFMAAVDGKGTFAFHTQLRDGESEEKIGDAEALAMFQAAVGEKIEAEILSRGTWTAGYALVAESFGRGRLFLGGDAAHLFTPAGGLGYNTAIEDAVNLGWKLAATIKGIGGPALLKSYELERKPAAVRNTGFARAFADSLGLFRPKDGLENEGAEGEALRAEAGTYLTQHGQKEFNIPGITFGTRYNESPIIVSEDKEPPPDSANEYIPTAQPGGRAPHLWLGDGRSLYDTFGFEWTLLRLGSSTSSVDLLVSEAKAARVDLKIVDIPSEDARQLYEAPLALIRPDQIVAWRGSRQEDAIAVLPLVLGRR
jgi:hypothetical protein